MLKKLSLIQSELKAPKKRFNSFGKYAYRSCEDILNTVKPLILKHDLTLILNDELVFIGDRFYIKATASLMDGSEKVITASGFAREEDAKKGMDSAQITGSVSSYARKYALNAMFLIDDSEDSDVSNIGEKQPISDEDIDSISKINNVDELRTFWNNNQKKYAKNGDFTKLVTDRKKELLNDNS